MPSPFIYIDSSVLLTLPANLSSAKFQNLCQRARELGTKIYTTKLCVEEYTLQWLANLGIALLFVGIGGRLTSVFTPGGLEGSKVRLHRVQATARNSEVGVRVARLLIGKKLHGQLGNLDWMTDSGRQVPVEDRLRHQRMRTAASQLHALQRTR